VRCASCNVAKWWTSEEIRAPIAAEWATLEHSFVASSTVFYLAHVRCVSPGVWTSVAPLGMMPTGRLHSNFGPPSTRTSPRRRRTHRRAGWSLVLMTDAVRTLLTRAVTLPRPYQTPATKHYQPSITDAQHYRRRAATTHSHSLFLSST